MEKSAKVFVAGHRGLVGSAIVRALEAANPAYETRIFGPDRVRIQGRLTGLMGEQDAIAAALTAKASSAIGFSEIFIVTLEGDGVRPHPLSEAGWDVLASASGWFTVRALSGRNAG